MSTAILYDLCVDVNNAFSDTQITVFIVLALSKYVHFIEWSLSNYTIQTTYLLTKRLG